MFDFINEFFKSGLAENDILVVIVLLIMTLMVGAFLMWLYMSKIYMKCVRNENAQLKEEVDALSEKVVSLEEELEKMTANRDDLLAQDDRLSFYDKMVRAREVAENEETDSAIDQFVNN